MLVDSHCHLDFPDFASDLPDVIDRAKAADVGAMLSISTHLSRFDRVLGIAERFETVRCTIGIHPHEAATESIPGHSQFCELTRHPKVVGIGETGLDYFYEHSPRQLQQASFRAHIAVARETGLPLVIHTRSADDDTAKILSEEMEEGAFTGVLHCFSSTPALAEQAIELGLYISFSGILTFKKAAELRDLAASLPADRILVETDAPYLAPVPRRGKRNEPSFVQHTAACLARVRGVTEAEIARVTTDNYFRLFSKARS